MVGSKIVDFTKKMGSDIDQSNRSVGMDRIVAKTVLGSGLGVVAAGLATATVVSVFGAALPAILIAKAAGMVGGTAGLIKGMSDQAERQGKTAIPV